MQSGEHVILLLTLPTSDQSFSTSVYFYLIKSRSGHYDWTLLPSLLSKTVIETWTEHGDACQQIFTIYGPGHPGVTNIADSPISQIL